MNARIVAVTPTWLTREAGVYVTPFKDRDGPFTIRVLMIDVTDSRAQEICAALKLRALLDGETCHVGTAPWWELVAEYMRPIMHTRIRDLAESIGVPVSGTKAELIARLCKLSNAGSIIRFLERQHKV